MPIKQFRRLLSVSRQGGVFAKQNIFRMIADMEQQFLIIDIAHPEYQTQRLKHFIFTPEKNFPAAHRSKIAAAGRINSGVKRQFIFAVFASGSNVFQYSPTDICRHDHRIQQKFDIVLFEQAVNSQPEYFRIDTKSDYRPIITDRPDNTGRMDLPACIKDFIQYAVRYLNPFGGKSPKQRHS